MDIDPSIPVPMSTMRLQLRMVMTLDGTTLTMDVTADATVHPGAEPVWPSDASAAPG
jgi:hypothetical protein